MYRDYKHDYLYTLKKSGCILNLNVALRHDANKHHKSGNPNI